MEKSIFITGASSGIGKVTSLYFAQQGWNVIATMRNPEKETELIKEPNIFVTKLEVTDPISIQNAIEQGIERFGQIDALINNAGYGQQGLFEAVSPEKIQAQFDVNVFGLMNVTRAILPHFRSRKSGTILNISSGAGRLTTPLLSIYCASKFAVEGFTEALAYELESQNIKVKLVEPGFIATPFNEKTTTSFAFDPSLTDYNTFNKEMGEFFKSFAGGNIFTAEDVAKVVFTAVTDNTYQLRYVAGTDIEQMIQVRNSKPDQEYVEFMRGLLRPNAFKG